MDFQQKIWETNGWATLNTPAKYIVIQCPKCYAYRAGEDKHKSWKCYRCNYSMNRKNTRIQGRPDNPAEVMEIIRLLKEDKI